MNLSADKRRRKLNNEQLEVLDLLYKFRFGSNNLFAQYFGKKDRSFVHKRLSILLEHNLIGKRFEPGYRLQGRPAAYYLTPEGARTLSEIRTIDINPKKIYKDKTVSESFVQHCMEIFAVHNQLRNTYSESLRFFTKTELSHEQYDYFPKPLPDAYMRLQVGSDEKQYFLEIIPGDQPFFVAARRITQYIKYQEDADWVVTETPLPIILMLCETEALAKRLQKRAIKALDDSWDADDVVFSFATKKVFFNGKQYAWRSADDPEVLKALEQL